MQHALFRTLHACLLDCLASAACETWAVPLECPSGHIVNDQQHHIALTSADKIVK